MSTSVAKKSEIDTITQSEINHEELKITDQSPLCHFQSSLKYNNYSTPSSPEENVPSEKSIEE